MPYAPVGYGAIVQGFGSPKTLSPLVPGGASPGNLLIMNTGVQMGTQASPVISGWTNIGAVAGDSSIQTTQALYARIMTGSGDAPTFNWTLSAFAYASIQCYTGNPSTLTGILASPAASAFNNIANNEILMPSVTMPTPNCLVIAMGCKDTGLTSNPTWQSFNSFTIQSQPFGSGAFAALYADWIQTTATNVVGGAWIHNTPNDSGSENNVGRIVALLPAPVVLPSTPYFDSVEEWG